MSKLLDELKRRKVFRVAAVYAVVAWVLIQVADTVLPALQMPQWTVSFVTVLFILGLLPTLIAAWAYEITPEGVKSDSASQASAQIPAPQNQNLIYAMLVLLIIAVGFQISDRFLFDGSQAVPEVPTATNTSASSVMRSSINLNHPLPRSQVGIATQLVLNADGSGLYYSRYNEADNQIWHRNLITGESRLFFDRVGSGYMQFSPDEQRLLMNGTDEYFIASLQGGGSQSIPLTKRNGPAGGWLNDEEILYPTLGGSIGRKSLTGNLDEILTDASASTQRSPYRLPGGQAFLYVDDDLTYSQIKVYDLRSGESKPLIDNAYMPRYAPSGHLVFIRDGDLWAAPFDLGSLDIVGGQARVVEGIDSQPNVRAASYAYSQFGRLVYLPGREYIPNQQGLTWIDRAGNTEDIPLPAGEYQQPELSPDGQAIALAVMQEGGSSDIWVYDLNRQTLGRRTFSGNALRPTWSPDGRQLFYQENAQGIWSINADGSGQPQQINSTTTARPASFSNTDGNLLYLEGPLGNASIKALSYIDSSWISSPLISTEGVNAWGAVVSPNGRWVAYVSNESGSAEIYVRPYPEVDSGKWQISTNGGREPQWGATGDELFYLQQTGTLGALFSVEIDDTNSFSPGTPRQLIEGIYILGNYPPNFDVTNDGEKFLIYSALVDEVGANGLSDVELVVVENWFEELKRLAPPDPQ